MTASLHRISGDAGLLAAVPALVGFRPTDSLVLVALRNGRSIGALRLDLPEPARVHAFASTATGLLCRIEGADSVAVVAYREASWADAGSAREAVDRVAMRAVEHGFALAGAFLVAADGWAGVAPGPRGRPRPLAELDAARHALPSAPAVLAVPPADAAERTAVADELERLEGSGFVVDLLREGGLDDLVETLLRDDAPSLPPHRIAEAAVLLARPAVRDVVLLQAAWGPRFGAHAAARTLEGLGGPLEDDDDVVVALGGGDMPRPDTARLRRAAALAEAVAARTDGPIAAAALASAGWCHWALGAGSRAGAVVDRATAIAPDASFVRLLAGLLDSGVVPDWAFRDEPDEPSRRRWSIPTGTTASGAR